MKQIKLQGFCSLRPKNANGNNKVLFHLNVDLVKKYTAKDYDQLI